MKVARRLARPVLAGVAALAVWTAGLPGLAPAAAAPPGPDRTPQPHDLLRLAGLDGTAHTVTLITGDRVRLTARGGDRYDVSVEPATRPDGSVPVVEATERGGDGLYAIPDDMRADIESGQLDEELFNVSYLATNGYADEATGQLPVIVEYAAPQPAGVLSASAESLPASATTTTLESINAAGVTVDKAQAGAFLASLRGGLARTHAEVKRIWLDRVAHVDLAESVPQVGAPQAWRAGFDGTGAKVAVLDTGIDATHPDVAGKVDATRSFLPDGSVADGHGHGTHVAATVAGTGAGSGGRYTGVAPGARLLVGKVCDNAGRCPSTAVIDGMEWAALEQRADVVSMSLGGGPTDGTDPQSRAVNQLTVATGTLFVIAAGNDGPGPYTVSSPGAADAALTVGAVDKSDAIAEFSSRGPRAGNHNIKPEITAPGVRIVAARAAGTAMGTPLDDRYTSASGTSMATPHVAGAAAVLAQQHPDWDADEIKAALVTTAADVGLSAFEQGGGRLDVARAVRQQVRLSPPTADFGFFPWPQQGPPATRTLTFTNPTGGAVELDVTASAANVDGAPLPDGALTLDADSVTVPAGGTATVTVTLDHTAVEPGRYTGSVVATGSDGLRLAAPIGFVVGEQTFKVTVSVRDRQDADHMETSSISLLGVDGDGSGHRAIGTYFPDSGNPAYPEELVGVPVAFHVPAGTYSIVADSSWFTANEVQSGLLFRPQVLVDRDVELVLDANAAKRITFDTPLPTETHWSVFQHQRTTTDGAAYTSLRFAGYGYHNIWVTPTEPVTVGEFQMSPQWLLHAPLVTMAVTRPERLNLHPVSYGGEVARFSGKRKIPVVYARRGTAEDFAGLDAHGKLVLMRGSEPCTQAYGNAAVSADQLDRATSAGAAGVIYHPEACMLPLGVPTSVPDIPFVALPSDEADTLIGLLGRGRVEIQVDGTPVSPYEYILKPYEFGRVPASLHYRFDRQDLAVVDDTFHAGEPRVFQRLWVIRRPTDGVVGGDAGARFPGPGTRRVFVGPLYADAVHQRGLWEGSDFGPGNEDRNEVFADPGRRQANWNQRPFAPGTPTSPPGLADVWLLPCAGCRQGDMFYPATHLGTADPVHTVGLLGLFTGEHEVHLYRDGREIPEAAPYLGLIARYQLPPEPTQYRMTQDFDKIHTAWHFRSGAVGDDQTPHGYGCVETLVEGSDKPCRAEPLIFLRYDAGVGLGNTVAAPGVHQLEVTAYRQAAAGPRIAGLKLWVSTDGGAHWRAVPVTPRGNSGEYLAAVDVPRPDRTSGTVSLRVEAWDADGNRVHQTVYDAYGIGRRTTNGQPRVL